MNQIMFWELISSWMRIQPVTKHSRNGVPRPSRTKLAKPMYSKENLTKINKLNALAPDAMKAFWAFDKVSVAEGVIPVK